VLQNEVQTFCWTTAMSSGRAEPCWVDEMGSKGTERCSAMVPLGLSTFPAFKERRERLQSIRLLYTGTALSDRSCHLDSSLPSGARP